MSQARFNLKSHRQDPALILLVYRVRGQRLVYSTGLHVALRYWDVARARVKSPHLYRPASPINDTLDRIAKECETFFAEGMVAGAWDFDVLRLALDRITLRGPQLEAVPTLPQFVKLVAAQRASSGKYKPSTILFYGTLFNRLSEYAKLNRTALALSGIDLKFFYGFTEFLFSGHDLATNTVAKTVRGLKVFMAEAEASGYQVNPAYKNASFRVAWANTAQVYLSEDELAKIEAADLELRLDRVRDVFLVACRTGVRYSDLGQIRAENLRVVDGVTLLTFSQAKTDDPVTIPVNAQVKAVLEKYAYALPSGISNQKYNDYLKEVCQAAGLRDRVVKYEYSGGIRKEVVVEKWEMVSSHSARRTFATLAFRAGVPVLSIAKMTGHRSEKTLLAYIRVSDEENAIMASKNPFFGE